MDCPGCSVLLADWKKSCACGWTKGSSIYEKVADHLLDQRCSFITGRERCSLLGTVTVGGGARAKYHCLWHHVILSDISRNTPTMFAEWRDALAASHPDSIWASDAEYLWGLLNGRPRKFNKRSDTNDDNTEDPELSKRCAKLIHSVLSHEVSREEYLKELMQLNKEYPGAGFLGSVRELRRHWALT